MVKHILLAGVTALAINGGVAFAQPATDDTSTTTQTTMAPPPPVAPPPAGTLATTHEHHAVDAYGNQTDAKSTTYRDSNGYAQDKSVRTTTAPPPPPPVTTSTQTETSTTGPQ